MSPTPSEGGEREQAHSPSSVDLSFILGSEDQERSASSPPRRQRAPAACLQCRRLKSKCNRPENGPCARCATLDIECEVVKSRRGRVLGSRNKRTGLEKSVAQVQAALDRIRRGAYSEERDDRERIKSERSTSARGRSKKRARGLSPEEELSSRSRSPTPPTAYKYEDAELPLDSARGSPDPEQHPLRLLSDVGSTLPAASSSIGWGVEGWTREELERASARRRQYFRHRPTAAKRDIARVLDPVYRGIVSEQQGEILVERFFKYMGPQVGLMDRRIHTLKNLRERSGLLTTAVLAASALSHNKELAEKLFAHADGVLMSLFARNAKSPEIVLALKVLMLWPRCPERIVDDRSRMLLAIAINMAYELGMNQIISPTEGDEETQRFLRDKTRTWCGLLVQDKSQAATSGKPTLIRDDPDPHELRRWMDHPYATPEDRMLVGYLELRGIERDARARFKNVERPYMIEGVRVGYHTLVEEWARQWILPEFDKEEPHHLMRVLGHHVNLLITTAAGAPPLEVVSEARKTLEFILQRWGPDARYICRTVCGMISWAAVLLLRLDRPASASLVRDMALSMAPHGTGPDSYAQFYGSFLLGLYLDGEAPPAGSVLPLAEPQNNLLVGDTAPDQNPTLLPQMPPDQPFLNFENLRFEMQWDIPQQPDVAPSLDWLWGDNTAGEGSLWNLGVDWTMDNWGQDGTRGP